jgi:hypothetical protein
MYQSNVTIRVDPVVQRACGRTGCAEQSTIARTLQASTAETIAQLDRVSWYYLKRYGQTPHHRFAERLLWIDVDVTPLLLGAQAEGSERTWMGRNRSRMDIEATTDGVDDMHWCTSRAHAGDDGEPPVLRL